ncbi:DUF2971 domain-containing protein [Pseudomonas aeruginosa]|uniref:DUF2971 domain-containing protein n=3 Tax=Pseudomonas TaxID=286 RepID=A0A3M4JVL0_9PSED|nr:MULTISPECIES: DUF2971 domain-containing protein [Pseudomonas]MCT8191216.1 DUF2971 domain-containing protein [Pseudomonas monteilii]TXG96981.1 MAG: DUF2971 domain-containing protein [Nevskiaceae bacterium]AGZ38086.1 hypothetical protein PVLB_26747 [Pseudomonas sp. VLB120]MDH0760430.1 DUF2971 domain-containing protein [Pseudomonas juntendi]MDH1917885.1 DUF2971 domain-containing protein [Pseudomonas juntendi]
MPTNEMRRREWIAAGYNSDMGSSIACSPPADSTAIRLYNLTSAKHALSNIEKRRLKVSRFADLNDPFELLAANFKEHKTRKVVRDWKDKSHSQHGLLCFAGDWSEPVMWSHYAEKHTGICLGFDVCRSLVQQVNYQDDRILAALSPAGTPDELSEELQQQLLRTKSAGWRYEQEYRSFVRLDTALADGPLHFWPVADEIQLTEVILGPLCEVPIESVRRRVEQHFPDAVVFKARLAFQSFKIVPDARTVL